MANEKHINDIIEQEATIASARGELVGDLTDHLFRFKPFSGLDESLLTSAAEQVVVAITALEVGRLRTEAEAQRLAEAAEAERDKRSADEIAAG